MKRRSVFRAMVILALVLAVLGTALPPGVADHGGPGHVVCIRVWYESPPGSQPHYVVNECRVATNWVPVTDDSECAILEGDPDTNVCFSYQISTP